MVESPDEIVNELFGDRMSADTSRIGLPPGLSSEGQRILSLLEGETLSADEICDRSGLELQPVLAALVELEVADCVLRAPGGLYRSIR